MQRKWRHKHTSRALHDTLRMPKKKKRCKKKKQNSLGPHFQFGLSHAIYLCLHIIRTDGKILKQKLILQCYLREQFQHWIAFHSNKFNFGISCLVILVLAYAYLFNSILSFVCSYTYYMYVRLNKNHQCHFIIIIIIKRNALIRKFDGAATEQQNDDNDKQIILIWLFCDGVSNGANNHLNKRKRKYEIKQKKKKSKLIEMMPSISIFRFLIIDFLLLWNNAMPSSIEYFVRWQIKNVHDARKIRLYYKRL